MTRDESPDVRREAVWAVSLYFRSEDIALLQARTQDEAWEVRTVAAMALTRMMAPPDLERWMDANIKRFSFDVLRELDFALDAPRWLKSKEPRIADNDLRLELDMCRPDFGGPSEGPSRLEHGRQTKSHAQAGC